MNKAFSFLSLSDSHIAGFKAFVYCVLVENHRALYVGQTRSRTGALGRLSFHLSDGDGATIRDRISALYRFDEVTLRGIRFAAFPLNPLKIFYSEARDYREAVEASLQRAIIDKLAVESIPLPVVSRVRYGGYLADPNVRSEVDRILPEMWQWILASRDEMFVGTNTHRVSTQMSQSPLAL
jgi:hypothetical protein